MKKLLPLILACLLLTGCAPETPPAPAEPLNSQSHESKLLSAAQVYLATILQQPEAVCTLGKAFSAYRLEESGPVPIDYEEYPVFVEGKILVIATGTLNSSGEYLTGCGTRFADALWQQYSQQPEAPFALIYAEDGAYLVREGEAPILLHKMPLPGCAPIGQLDSHRATLVYSGL